MHKKPILMIHEIREWMLELPLEDYTLTFDDGLYSQYYYFSHFKSIKTEKVYFISTDVISNGAQSTMFPTCREAHEKYRNGITEDYMTKDQIIELLEDPLVDIGGHSHQHKNLSTMSIADAYTHVKQDTERMLNWFETNLSYRPTKFCYPYNQDWHGLYKKILGGYGFTDFYGNERTAIEDLITTIN